MRGRRILSLIVGAAVVGALVPTAGNASPATSRLQTLTYFFKQTSQSFTTASGKPLSSNQALARGDILFVTDNMYLGDKAHHNQKSTATAFLYCTVKKVTKSAAKAQCQGVIALGKSMLISESAQNLASTSKTHLYPITGGTGKYLNATGGVTTTDLNKSGTESNGVLKID